MPLLKYIGYILYEYIYTVYNTYIYIDISLYILYYILRTPFLKYVFSFQLEIP